MCTIAASSYSVPPWTLRAGGATMPTLCVLRRSVVEKSFQVSEESGLQEYMEQMLTYIL